MSKLTVARALTAHVAKRMVNLATIMAVIVFLFALLATTLLVYFFSAWWWLLLVPFILLLGLFFVVRLIILLIVGRIHTERLSKAQRTALDDFTGNIEALIEARATPLPVFVMISIKDLLLHRDITTIKRLIKDSVNLRRDYQRLEELFR